MDAIESIHEDVKALGSLAKDEDLGTILKDGYARLDQWNREPFLESCGIYRLDTDEIDFTKTIGEPGGPECNQVVSGYRKNFL